jgi:non-ribosomal peptide synthetase component F
MEKMKTRSWLCRPALAWMQVLSSEETATCYWKLPPVAGVVGKTNGRGRFFCLPYQAYYGLSTFLAVETARQLQAQIVLNRSSAISSSTLLHIPIAVSIPEGPLLPIVVTALHFLNSPWVFLDQKISVVLVPLDPGDGTSRLQSMLRNVRPAIVFTASDSDLRRMQDIAATINREDNSEITDGPLYRSAEISVIDAWELVAGARISTQDWQISDASSVSLEDTFKVCMSATQNSGFELVENASEKRISHIVFTSGTSGEPKGCVSSAESLVHYLNAKNKAHEISCESTILLASSLSFDPCISDILATITAKATLLIAPRNQLLQNLGWVIGEGFVTHVLCTPTLWSTLQITSRRDFPNLRVVALGGEPIPRRMLRSWARSSNDEESSLRLCATYGVTEACVYQTFGEVFRKDDEPIGSHDVGFPFDGLGVRLCEENDRSILVDLQNGRVGEVVLFGRQIDELSFYLCQPELSSSKFIKIGTTHFYRTGDRGFLHPNTSQLHIMGRIAGEDGMVKINGARIELGEIETAIVDKCDDQNIVIDCIAVASNQDGDQKSSVATDLYAYLVLSQDVLREIGILSGIPDGGFNCAEVPVLLTLLRHRCKQVSPVIPSTFIAIPRVPLSRTGKKDKAGVPPPDDVVKVSSFGCSVGTILDDTSLLIKYGRSGSLVAKEIIDCLNLNSSQQALVTTATTFAMLGGDSLAATRVVRALYARHNKVRDSRNIGGKYGMLEGPFNVIHFLKTKNLGAYVDFLDTHQVCSEDLEPLSNQPSDDSEDRTCTCTNKLIDPQTDRSSELFEALLQACTFGWECLAMALLDLEGCEVDFSDHSGRRLGNTFGQMQRKQAFRSSPLHLACLHGKSRLVGKLLKKGSKYNIPNPVGMFPLHLAVSGEFQEIALGGDQDSQQRHCCVCALLEAGAPLFTKDASKQTVLHAAARAGRVQDLVYLLGKWLEHDGGAKKLQWHDNWDRTPVHWAVINGHVEALNVLLESGCDPNPLKSKHGHKRTSAAIESPLEVCDRLYSGTKTGKLMKKLLEKAMLT